jgi:hypothetical protein
VALGVSSPHFHQSNGVAEAGVKSMKKLIAGSFTSNSFDINKFGQSLVLFRNTAISGGQSPAQIVFHRPMRDCLPAHRRSFAAEWQKDAEILKKTGKTCEGAEDRTLQSLSTSVAASPGRQCSRDSAPDLKMLWHTRHHRRSWTKSRLNACSVETGASYVVESR